MIEHTTQAIEGSAYVMTWPGMVLGEVGDPVKFAGAADRTVQVLGTFGGAAIAWEGSLDGLNYETLTDPQGDPLSISAAKIETVLELTRFIRPLVVGGDGTTSLTAILLVRSTMR